MNPPGESRKSGPQRLLDLVERLGNKVPHPAVLFVLLIAVVVVLSYLLERIGTSATYRASIRKRTRSNPSQRPSIACYRQTASALFSLR